MVDRNLEKNRSMSVGFGHTRHTGRKGRPQGIFDLDCRQAQIFGVVFATSMVKLLAPILDIRDRDRTPFFEKVNLFGGADQNAKGVIKSASLNLQTKFSNGTSDGICRPGVGIRFGRHVEFHIVRQSGFEIVLNLETLAKVLRAKAVEGDGASKWVDSGPTRPKFPIVTPTGTGNRPPTDVDDGGSDSRGLLGLGCLCAETHVSRFHARGRSTKSRVHKRRLYLLDGSRASGWLTERLRGERHSPGHSREPSGRGRRRVVSR